MGEIKYDQESGSLEIIYGGRESPFAGLDASAPAPYIAPNGLASGTKNFFTLNGTLTGIDFSPLVLFTPSATQTFIGIGDLNGVLFYIYFDSSVNTIYLCYDTTPTNTVPTWSGTISFALPLMADSPQPVAGSLTYKNVNSISYFSFNACPYILQWDGNTLGVLTQWLGCAYLNELNGRLIAANIYQIAQAPPNNTYTGTPAPVTATVSGTGSNTSGAMSFPSNVIGAGAGVQLQITYNGTWIVKPPGVNNVAFNFQYSTDGGVTWTTFASASNIRQSGSTGNLSRSLDLGAAGITNADQVELQVIVTTNTFSGSTSATANIVSASLTVTNSPVPPVFTQYPYQVAWSAAESQYEIWNTLSTAGLVTGAGFNNLPDVEDSITGMLMEGPTGFLLRQQGITEITGLASGIQPFSFNHMWASHQGIGTKFPEAAAQYGALGFIPANDDIYTIGPAGINVVGGVAKSQIYADLYHSEGTVVGGAGYLCIDGETSAVYIIIAVNVASPTAPSNCYIYWQAKNIWFTFQLIGSYTPLQISASNPLIGSQRIATKNGLNIIVQATSGVIYILTFDVNSSLYGNSSPVVIFPAEEVEFLRDITVDGIGLYVYVVGPSNGTFQISLSVNGVTFTSLTNGVYDPNGSWQYIKAYPVSNLAYTGTTPQLTASISGASNPATSIRFGKIIIYGSKDSTQRPF